MITPQIEKALLRAQAYLGGRQCHNGGFCFYRNDYLEEPNLHDTYHALAGYSLLERPIPNREKIISYLAHQRSRSHQPAYLYYYTFSVRLLESVPDEGTMADIEGLRLATPDNRTEFSSWIVTALKVVCLKRTLSCFKPDAKIVAYIRQSQREGGGYGAKPNLEDTWFALSLLDKIKAIEHVEDTIRFIEEMQIPSLGFRNTRDSRYSNIYILHAGVLSCALLGVSIRYPAAIMDMVLPCQCANGAFAPVSVSLPNLHTHYMAIKLIKTLLEQHVEQKG